MAERCAGAVSFEGPCGSHASGPPASVSRTFTMPTSRSAVKGLTKAEVSQLLQESGLPFSPDWSVDELKQILKENMFPKAKTAAQMQMKGLDSTKSAQLLAKATEIGAHTTPGMTKPSLKLSIRKAILQKHTPEANDYMGFGKYGAMTYQQVRAQHVRV